MEELIKLQEFVVEQINKADLDYTIEKFNGGTATASVLIEVEHKSGLDISIDGNVIGVVENYRPASDSPEEFDLVICYFEGEVSVFHAGILLLCQKQVLLSVK